MKKETVLLSVTEYDFNNDDGERVKGATVFLLSDELKGQGQRGYRVGKFSVDNDTVSKLKTVPCVVNADFDLKVNNKNEASLSLSHLTYVKDYPLGV